MLLMSLFCCTSVVIFDRAEAGAVHPGGYASKDVQRCCGGWSWQIISQRIKWKMTRPLARGIWTVVFKLRHSKAKCRAPVYSRAPGPVRVRRIA